jgi:hypothetical protein
MQAMRLSNEVCILALIFIDKLIKLASVQVLTINWNPILYAAILLAAKYWEDFYFWNIDYVDCIRAYSLQATNRLESTFLALCEYGLFVPEAKYEKYFRAILSDCEVSTRCSSFSVSQ